MKKILGALSIGMGLMVTAPAVVAQVDEITVGYFQEWPMPFLAAKAAGTYDEALGVKVNWRTFNTGTAMSAAMASGDVQLSVSQGVPPYVVAASAGQAIEIIDVAVSYSDNDNCVVRADLEIDKDSASELVGLRVAVPLGTAAHYGFLRQMSHFNVPLSSLTILNMPPPEGAAALGQGSVDFACGWGGGLSRMKEHGNILLTGAEKEELGILVFDITSAPSDFIAENADLAAKFLKVTADANAVWNANHDADMLAVIAKESGMDMADAEASLAGFTFPSIQEQLSSKWFGGSAQIFMKGVADVFVESGSIDSALSSYEDSVNTGDRKSVV